MTADTAQFDRIAAAHVDPDRIPGLVALLAHGADTHVVVAGQQALGGPPMRRDSLFRIASITKPITGVAILALIEEGRLGLDDPVSRWLPELAEPRVLSTMDGPLTDTIPAQRPITVADLLTYRYGFGMHVDMFSADPPWPIVAAEAELAVKTIGPPQPQTPPDPDTWLAQLATLPLLAQPGQRWFYQTSAAVLGVLAARVAGQPFGEVLRTRIFQPLGMVDTAFWTERTDRLVTGYQTGPDGLQVAEPPDGQWSRPPAFEDGAAGLVSTVDDLAAFARMLATGGGPVLSAASVAAMTTNQLTAEQIQDATGFLDGGGWGYSVSVTTDGPRAGAYGWTGGLGTSWLTDPRRDLTVIVLTQRYFDSPTPPTVHADLQKAAYAAVG